MAENEHCKLIGDVLDVENTKLAEIRGRRKDGSGNPIAPPTAGPIGVACSGGGIRSATLNLGILEVLRERGIIERTDYLSTVSGGGFIGGWLVAGANRCTDWLKPDVPHRWGLAIEHLRNHASYLSPRLGVLSADSWAMIMIWSRNALLIQLTLLFLLSSLLLAPRVIGALLPHWLALDSWRLLLLLGLYGFAIWKVWGNLKAFATSMEKDEAGDVAVQRSIVVPLFLFSLLAGGELWKALENLPRQHLLYSFLLKQFFFAAWWPAAIAVAGITLGVTGFLSLKKWSLAGAGYALLSAVVATVALYCIVILVLFVFQDWKLASAVSGYWCSFAVAGVSVLYGFALSITLQIGMLGAEMPDERREWWSRLGAWFFLYGSGWLLLTLASVLGPLLVHWLIEQGAHWWATAGVGWVVSTLGSLFAGKSGSTSGKTAGSSKKEPDKLETLLSVGPYVFLAGTFLLVATGLHDFMINVSDWDQNKLYSWQGVPFAVDYWDQMRYLCLCGYLVAIGIAAFLLILFSLRVDINEFSLNSFYRNRLVRCYLGATRKRKAKAHRKGADQQEAADLANCPDQKPRSPHPFTGFDDEDDFPLTRIAGNAKYAGPIPILNTTLNLGASPDLDGGVQSRQSASFFFTPYHAGADRDLIRFREQSSYVTGGVSLGTAIAVSGAAASPNQGYHTSPAVAFLMTVFDARLGWWMRNPDQIKNAGPADPTLRFSAMYLVNELFGMAGERSKFVNLSDGGHLENLGIYELVRRKCSLIIAGDGEQDLDLQFGSLGNVIRMCKVDFNADIDIDISRIRPDEKTGLSEAHCAAGRITYRDGAKETHGTLIYLKSSFSGDEPADVQQYRSEHPDFPHETTADQFFSEAQFESYRKLGRHIAEEAFAEIVETGDTPDLNILVPELMRQRWHARSSIADGAFSQHTQTLNKIWSEIRDNHELSFLDQQTYPEWSSAVPHSAFVHWIPSDEKAFRKAFYVCNQVIQLMESVYHDLKLEDRKEREHPDNTGWMNFFRHWSSSGMFRVAWAIAGCTYGAGFQRFCLNQLGLKYDHSKEVVNFDPEHHQLNGVELQRRDEMDKDGKFQIKLLMVVVSHRTDGDKNFRCHAGFALLDGNTLRYIRVQDHLRKMGLGTWFLSDLRAKSPGLRIDPLFEAHCQEWERERFRKWARRRGFTA